MTARHLTFQRMALLLLLALAAWHALATVVSMVMRSGLPFPIEWSEQVVFVQTLRAYRGERLFQAPGIGFVGDLYPPLFAWLGGLLFTITGPGLAPLRAFSAVAALACTGLIFLLARALGSGRIGAGIAGAALLACYHVSGAWYDLARVDMLAMAFALASWWVALRAGRRPAQAVIAGVLLALSVLTKQSMALMAGPVVTWLLVRHGWPSLARGAAGGWLVALLFIALLGTGESLEWAWFYLLILPASHGVRDGALAEFWLQHWVFGLLPWLLLTLAAVAQGLRRADPQLLIALAGSTVAACLGFIKVGGVLNAVLPVFAVFALGAGLGVDLALRSRPITATLVASALCALQFVRLLHDPRGDWPSARWLSQRAAAEQTLSTLRGAVWVPSDPATALRAGHDIYALNTSLQMIWIADTVPSRITRESVETAVMTRRFDHIVLYKMRDAALQPLIQRDYVLKQTITFERQPGFATEDWLVFEAKP